MRDSQKHRTALLLRLSIVVVLLLLVNLEMSWPQAHSSMAAPPGTSNTLTTSPVEDGVATLSASNMKTWRHNFKWTSDKTYCGSGDSPWAFSVDYAEEEIAYTVVAGYKHDYDKGAIVFGCPSGRNAVFRGTVWFDLSEIISKAPPLHVSVQSATLHFKQMSGSCPGELLIANEDWLKGYPGDLVPGGPFARVTDNPFDYPIAKKALCVSGGCNIDVATVVNNWVRGEEHGGYANYGFVFMGGVEDDVHYDDSSSCLARYGEFSLTVNYKYDKPLIYIPLPTPIPVAKPGVSSPTEGRLGLARTNFALPVNGGKAVASSTLPPYLESYVNDGDRTGAGGDKLWLDNTPNSFPDYIEIDLAGKKAIDEIDVITIQDNFKTAGEPTLFLPFNEYGITFYQVQYLDGGAWITVPGGDVGRGKFAPAPNDKVWRQFTLTPKILTDKIRITINGSRDNKYSRVVEVEAWGN